MATRGWLGLERNWGLSSSSTPWSPLEKPNLRIIPIVNMDKYGWLCISALYPHSIHGSLSYCSIISVYIRYISNITPEYKILLVNYTYPQCMQIYRYTHVYPQYIYPMIFPQDITIISLYRYYIPNWSETTQFNIFFPTVSHLYPYYITIISLL